MCTFVSSRNALKWWISKNRPRYGIIYHNIRTTHALFKYVVKITKRNEETARADTLVRDLYDKDIDELWSNSRYTTNIPTDLCTVTRAVIKANMRDIHKSIASQHLAARDNNKILGTNPPQISSTQENLPAHASYPSPTKIK